MPYKCVWQQICLLPCPMNGTTRHSGVHRTWGTGGVKDSPYCLLGQSNMPDCRWYTSFCSIEIVASTHSWRALCNMCVAHSYLPQLCQHGLDGQSRVLSFRGGWGDVVSGLDLSPILIFWGTVVGQSLVFLWWGFRVFRGELFPFVFEVRRVMKDGQWGFVVSAFFNHLSELCWEMVWIVFGWCTCMVLSWTFQKDYSIGL